MGGGEESSIYYIKKTKQLLVCFLIEEIKHFNIDKTFLIFRKYFSNYKVTNFTHNWQPDKQANRIQPKCSFLGNKHRYNQWKKWKGEKALQHFQWAWEIHFNCQNATKTTILKIISLKTIQSKKPFSLQQTRCGKIEKLGSLPLLWIK